MSATLTHPEPPLTRADHARFDAWFMRESSLPEIAKALSLPVIELADWAAQPHIRARLDAVKQVAHDRNELLHVEAKHHALFRLTSIVIHAENSESSLKAATRILMSRLETAPARTRQVLSPSIDQPRMLSAATLTKPSKTPSNATPALKSEPSTTFPQPTAPHLATTPPEFSIPALFTPVTAPLTRHRSPPRHSAASLAQRAGARPASARNGHDSS